VGEVAYNNLRDYAVQANRAKGGGDPPASGWVTLASVTGNRYHSREHVVDLTGFNWLRLAVRASDGSPANDDAGLNLDVRATGRGMPDSWMFYGDSITQDAMHHAPVAGSPNFGELVRAARPGRYPVFEDGGTWGLHASDGARRITGWLRDFPGRYVGLAFGTNDAAACAPPAGFRADYTKMIRAVLAAGKVPVVPTIPWARAANVRRCGPALNAQIRRLYGEFPRVVRGPDLWAYFAQHRRLIALDGLHPSPAGFAAYRRLWAERAVAVPAR
jgi:lysophospholipase L1-like esterase